MAVLRGTDADSEVYTALADATYRLHLKLRTLPAPFNPTKQGGA